MSGTAKEAGPPRVAGTSLSFPAFLNSVRKPKGQMPPFSSRQVSDQELLDVYAFLHAADLGPKLLLPSSANPQNGPRFYVAFGCYECHGYEGQGSTQTGGSRIGPPQIPFSGFVTYIRQPIGQMPPYAAKAVTHAQLADIYIFLQSCPDAPPANSIPLLNQ
jgi:mono/diheme cytochrome c family protein